jgi:hypothetical protein
MGRGVIQQSAGAADIHERRLALLLHHTMEIDYVGGTNPIFIGWAEPGTPTAKDAWKIAFITWDANDNPLTITWAEGTMAYSHVWDLRAGYAYS